MKNNYSILISDKPPRYLIVAFFLFTALVLGVGFFQIRNNVYAVFSGQVQVVKSNVSQNILPESLDKVLQEQAKDTDQDGLPDYDEVYFYNTSIYLADSDSDGLSDAEEVQNNTDPNCPEGTDCSQFKIRESENSENLNEPQRNNLVEESLLNEDKSKEGLIPSGAQIRKMFSQSPELVQLLENFTDEELEQFFSQSYNQVTQTGDDTAATLSQLLQNSDFSQTLTPEDMKKMLESLIKPQ